MKQVNYLLLFFCVVTATAQQNFTKQDSLRGSITPERAWWDVQKYTLNVEVFPESKSIKGTNLIDYKVLQAKQVLQLELQAPLVIDSIVQDKQLLSYTNKGFSYFINLKKEQLAGQTEQIQVYYHGQPKEAKQAPWDGGFVWKKDRNGKPFIATANQSIGPSIWWPCKDHPYDEAESAQITITCPSTVLNVSNGKPTQTIKHNNGTTSYTWEVKNPINSYGIAVNIADYAHFSETYKGLNGDLDCNYYVQKENLEKAKIHFKDAIKTLEAFEYWLGPYPFYKDGYKLVETPYLGMEHQSCVAYGNKYLKGYLGKPMGTSHMAKKFDFIIVHESGHEWFANSITSKDVADLWVHEAFTTYAESLFLDYHYGTPTANLYVQGLRVRVQNDKPIIGAYNVHNEGSADMYFKGSLMLHTLRQIINNDVLWRKLLLGLNTEFYHKIITGDQVIAYINKHTEIDLVPFFHQYLTTTNIPQLTLQQKGKYIYYKWDGTVSDFKIPVKVYIKNKELWISPNQKKWKQLKGKLKDFKVDANYYINTIIKKK